MTSGDTLTPGALAARLGVSDRTVRRMGETWERVHGEGALPRDRRGHRLFPADVADRLEVAARTLRDSPGVSLEETLTAQRDGVPLPRHPDRTPSADALAPLLDELRAVRGELADLRALLLAFLGAEGHDAALSDLPPPSEPGDERAAPQRPRKLQPNHAALLERLQAGARLLNRGGRMLEVAADNELRAVDPRTVAALERYGLLERDGDEWRVVRAAQHANGAY